MFRATITIEAETQEQIENALRVVSVDLRDSDLREGRLTIQSTTYDPYKVKADFDEST